jgi:N-methylhydantoinase A
MSPSALRIGVDIGGTFTDIVVASGAGPVATRKVPSTTDDYARGIVSALTAILDEHRIDPREVGQIIHATTVGTNAILQGSGARTALITSEGFRDVLELRRIRIPELYDLLYERPAPLVPRRWRFEVAERIGPEGQVWKPLDTSSVTAVIEEIRRHELESVAVCLLNSYRNPVHEEIVAGIVQKAFPNLFVTHSAEILREIREYERTSTTVINAYVGPTIQRYLGSLVTRLRGAGIGAPVFIMQCNGEMMTAEMAERLPCNLVESGPAAGVKGAARLAQEAGYERMITLDVGGTTAKVAAIENGRVLLTSDYEVGGGINVRSQLVRGGGYALKVPAVDLTEVGAGGGSIAWLDAGGRLHVGPQSAGAVPGPVCYGLGGAHATLTDANLVLGYLPRGLAAGTVILDHDDAAAAIKAQVGDPLGLSLLQAAFGVYEIASANMVRAVKAVSTFRGRDPRDSVLVAFGGCGPMCAAQMARSLGMQRIVIPRDAGLFSALGLLTAQLQFGRSQTYLRRADAASVDSLNAALADLEKEARERMSLGKYEGEVIRVVRHADMRYADQGYELTVQVPGGPLSAGDVAELVSAFEAEHDTTYGHRAVDEDVDIVNLRVTVDIARGGGQESFDWASGAQGRPGLTPSDASREAYFGSVHGRLVTPVTDRNGLSRTPVKGPLIVEEYDFTCVIPPDYFVFRDEVGSIVMESA